jgi:hypothetical protein
MKNKTLALIALTGAPAMFVGVLVENNYPDLKDSWLTTAWGVLYITTWLVGSLTCMRRMQITGTTALGKGLLKVLTVTLIIANISNFLWIVFPDDKPALFFAFDLFWPVSHALMIPIGIMSIRAGRLPGWARFVPLMQGLWLPLALGSIAIFDRTNTVFFFGGLYNATTWALMAVVLYRESKRLETGVSGENSSYALA